jgi:hypothetical protein
VLVQSQCEANRHQQSTWQNQTNNVGIKYTATTFFQITILGTVQQLVEYATLTGYKFTLLQLLILAQSFEECMK